MANEKLQYEIAALYSGQPEIKKAFDDFAKLNAAGSKVVQKLKDLDKANKDAGKAISESRRASAQLGMQFNQLGTQVAGGTSLLLALQQQLGDVGYALSGMGGRLGKVGAFLAGTWGASIIFASSILGPFIKSLFDSGDEAEKASGKLEQIAFSSNAVSNAQGILGGVMEMTTGKINTQSAALIALARAQLAVAQIESRERQAKAGAQMAEMTSKYGPGYNVAAAGGMFQQDRPLSRLQEELRTGKKNTDQVVKSLQGMLAIGQISQGMFTDLAKAYANFGVEAENQKVFTEAQKLLDGTGGTGLLQNKGGKEAKNNVKEIDVLLERQKALFAQYKSGTLAYGEYLNKLNEVTEAYKRNGESEKDMFRSQLEGFKDAQRIREKTPMLAVDQAGDLIAGANSIVEKFESRYLDSYNVVAEQIKTRNEEIKNSFDSIGLSVADAFKGMLTAGMSWRDGMKGIINSVIDQLWQMFVVKQITGFVTKTLGNAFGLPGFANGTVNAPGGMALVGERGPEIVNLPRGSQVIPAHRSKNMAGGGVTVNVDARGSADPAAVRAQVQQGILEAAPALIAAAEQRTMANLRRPRLGGAMQ